MHVLHERAGRKKKAGEAVEHMTPPLCSGRASLASGLNR